MKTFTILILFIFYSSMVYAQSENKFYLTKPDTEIVSIESVVIDSSNIDSSETISMAGAITFSTIFPGAGLFLSDNYGPAIAYLTFVGGLYITGVVFLLSGEGGGNPDIFLPLFLVGGFIHLGSIVHTIIATNDYNENISPYVSYNGRMVQFGLSLKL